MRLKASSQGARQPPPLFYHLTHRVRACWQVFKHYWSRNGAASSGGPCACLGSFCASFQAAHACRVSFCAPARHFDRDASECVNLAGQLCVPGGVLWVSVPYVCYEPINFRLALHPLIMGDDLSHWGGSSFPVGARKIHLLTFLAKKPNVRDVRESGNNSRPRCLQPPSKALERGFRVLCLG